MLSAQELFDKAALGILRQGRRSTNSLGHCQYRGDGGRKCAVGHVIPDELYSPMFDAMGSLTSVASMLKDKMPEIWDNLELLGQLQVVHDQNGPSKWQELLCSVASNFGLSDRAVVEFADAN